VLACGRDETSCGFLRELRDDGTVEHFIIYDLKGIAQKMCTWCTITGTIAGETITQMTPSKST
jgi:hypothetical protein